jgi:high-affinity Fe2+/Pb2+ permease
MSNDLKIFLFIIGLFLSLILIFLFGLSLDYLHRKVKYYRQYRIMYNLSKNFKQVECRKELSILADSIYEVYKSQKFFTENH